MEKQCQNYKAYHLMILLWFENRVEYRLSTPVSLVTSVINVGTVECRHQFLILVIDMKLKTCHATVYSLIHRDR